VGKEFTNGIRFPIGLNLWLVLGRDFPVTACQGLDLPQQVLELDSLIFHTLFRIDRKTASLFLELLTLRSLEKRVATKLDPKVSKKCL